MSVNNEGFFNKVEHLLEQDYRGVNIAVYALATAGLVASIHKIRPVSKFSKASAVPNHFIRNHETLKGSYVGVQHSPLRLLVDHRAPIYLPLWHSAKPPLPVKLWGIEVESANAVNWLECVAKGQKLTLTPVSKENDELVSKVLLHLPKKRKNTIETIDIGERLIELGFAKASLPRNIKKSTIESTLAPVLLSAEHRAKKYRQGFWSDTLPPLPLYTVLWRKGSRITAIIATVAAKKLIVLFSITSKGIFEVIKKLVLRPFRATPKQVQTT